MKTINTGDLVTINGYGQVFVVTDFRTMWGGDTRLRLETKDGRFLYAWLRDVKKVVTA